ncbi:doublesex- and mab-3-related transcription factor C2-like [Archocentrus centrarchus]|uniref:doublesex- and mab-3-related transcription factor C2-like n=1 Tax=Archocentrus centrarchus TaxID=63155 RepID=UPI0011EA03E8|nr:doublesex- and mab-3-related transcription factor C2-like [Archocentrus centrarchus]
MSLPNSFDNSGRPKCARCRHHGIVTLKKGHTKICPYIKCECSKCSLITQRTKIAALQREMRKTKKEQQPGAGSGDGRAPSTSAPMGPQSGWAPEKGTPADPWGRPESGGQPVSGSSRRDELPSTSGKRLPLNTPGFDEHGQVGPLPFIPFPFRMPSCYPSSYSSPPPHLMPNMQWVPPVAVGFGPLMFPHPHQGAVNYPLPPNPRPPAGCRQVFMRHPQPVSQTFKDEQRPPPPVPKTPEQDAAEQVNRGNES